MGSLHEVSRGEELAVQAARVASLNWELHHHTGRFAPLPDLEAGLAERMARREQVLAALEASPAPLRTWDETR